ncbi:ComEC family competence protein [Anaerohalosphaera lusitana]|uniref:ComEC family competence protein n=1 Tax=Anaerohalosphaera lusitana TaxID=1936003 RepID=A0A1U9NLL4_9BACT|nr:DNA internalization-related competence protein ComEC/Rec2 [Anaerohalosphaera lusitana]AQT68832.1 ComEC family competence protein [Anaerohalosphaera lusitana]
MDQIRQQLKLLDEQLAERRSLFDFFMSRSPLFLLAVGLTAGIAVQHLCGLNAVFWFIAIVVLAGAAVLVSRWDAGGGRSVAFIAIALFMGIGAVRVASYETLPGNHITRVAGEERTLATLRGRVCSKVFTPGRDAWAFSGWGFNKPGSSFYLECESVKTRGGFAAVSGKVRVQVNSKVRSVQCGDLVELHCWLDRFSPPTNPGEFDFQAYLARRNIHVGASVNGAGSIRVVESNGWASLPGVRVRLADLFREQLIEDGCAGMQTRGLIEALLLGNRSNIDAETHAAFRKTGLAHFISLSGMHIGMFAYFVWVLCRHAGFLKTARAMILMGVVGVYVLAVPSRPPTTRAAILCFFFALSVIVNRKPNALNTLGLAGICLLLYRPTQLFNAGFQLSFATVLGIILLQPRLHSFANRVVGDRLGELYAASSVGAAKFAIWVGRHMLELLTVGAAAWIGGAAIILYHFGSVSGASAVWTVFAYPLVLAIIAGSMVQILAGMVFPTVGVALSVFVDSMAECLIWLVRFLAEIDVTALRVGEVAIWMVVVYYAGVLFMRFGQYRRRVLRRMGVSAACVGVLLPFGVNLLARGEDGLRLTVLNVGHGQAVLLETPSGENMLFDAGSLTRNDIGSRVVVPFLQHRGIDRLDAVCISHEDIDHLNGLPEIVEQCDVERILGNRGVIESDSATASFLRDAVAERGGSLTLLDGGLLDGGSVKIDVIWPVESAAGDIALSDNDSSSVFLVRFAGRSILISSDIEEYAQGGIMERYPDLGADVLILPHHGSTTHLVESFVQSLEPEVVIASCSRGRLNSVYRPDFDGDHYATASHGAVTVEIGVDGDVSACGHLRPGE